MSESEFDIYLQRIRMLARIRLFGSIVLSIGTILSLLVTFLYRDNLVLFLATAVVAFTGGFVMLGAWFAEWRGRQRSRTEARRTALSLGLDILD